MIDIDVSTGKPYHTQINNKKLPMSACNTTSSVMFLIDNDVELPDVGDEQEEDVLTGITESPEAYEAMRRLAPWAFRPFRTGEPTYPPAQVHVMLDWAMERWIGRKVSIFREDVSLEELALELVRGRTMVINGRFTAGGHMVELVGLRSSQDDLKLARWPGDVDLRAIEWWRIDDPYGNYHTRYEDPRGNGVTIPREQFNDLTNDYGKNRKWAHLYREA